MTWGGKILTNLFRPSRAGRGWWYRFFSTSNTWNEIDYLDAFNTIPELNAVINLKGRAHANAIYKHVDADGNDLDSDLNNVLKNPNWFQAQKEFIRQTVLFHEIFGNEFIYALFPIGIPANVKALFTISPNVLTVEYKEKTPYFYHETRPNIVYLLKGDNYTQEIEANQVIHLNDNRVTVTNVDDKTILQGESKIKPLKAVINNIKMAYESRGVILKHRGALGILSNAGKDGTGAPLPVDSEEKERLQDQYSQGYGGLDGQYQIIISDSNLKWQQMGANPDRLGLFEEIEKDFDKILDAFGVPPEMFASKVGATYENQAAAEKGLYLRTIIPEANERAQALTARLLPDSDERIIADFSHLPIFQEDIMQKATALKIGSEALSKLFSDGAITIEQYQAELIKYGIDNPKQN